MRFGEKIRSLRLEKKLTQEEVANKVGVSRRAYILYEKGEVEPRTKEIYVKLAKVLDCDVEYLLKDDASTEKSWITPFAASLTSLIATLPLTAIAPLAAPIIAGGVAATTAVVEKKTKAESIHKEQSKQEEIEDVKTISTERILQYEKYIQRFSATASGLIVAKLALNGNRFQVGSIRDVDYQCYDNDTLLHLDGSSIETWLIKYCALSEGDRQLDKFAMQMAVSTLSSLMFLPKDKKRKVSIVVNHKELFEYLLNLTKDNSYGGNLSIIYVDTAEVRVVEEVYVASLSDGAEDTLVKIV